MNLIYNFMQIIDLITTKNILEKMNYINLFYNIIKINKYNKYQINYIYYSRKLIEKILDFVFLFLLINRNKNNFLSFYFKIKLI